MEKMVRSGYGLLKNAHYENKDRERFDTDEPTHQ